MILTEGKKSMQYIWMFMISAVLANWCIASVMDFIRVFKEYTHPKLWWEHMREYAQMFFATVFFGVFIASLVMYIWERI